MVFSKFARRYVSSFVTRLISALTFFFLVSRSGYGGPHVNINGNLHLTSFIQSVASMHSFFLAMTLFPEIQKRCQAEIDSVTGGTRLPDLSDKDNLPYMNAVMWELMRWQPVSPLGMLCVLLAIIFFFLFLSCKW